MLIAISLLTGCILQAERRVIDTIQQCKVQLLPMSQTARKLESSEDVPLIMHMTHLDVRFQVLKAKLSASILSCQRA